MTDLRLGGSEIVVRGGTVDQRCIDRGFASNISIAGGIVCYSQTMARSRAVYVCDNNTQANDVTRVCQRDGTWNGTTPSCPGIIVYSTHNKFPPESVSTNTKFNGKPEMRGLGIHMLGTTFNFYSKIFFFHCCKKITN